LQCSPATVWECAAVLVGGVAAAAVAVAVAVPVAVPVAAVAAHSSSPAIAALVLVVVVMPLLHGCPPCLSMYLLALCPCILHRPPDYVFDASACLPVCLSACLLHLVRPACLFFTPHNTTCAGAGKSSLIAALLRLRPLESGAIYVCGGANAASLPLRELRSRCAVVPQCPVLFGGAVRDNLDAAGAVTDPALVAVLKV
jgi:hypothetical protein